MSVWLSFKFRRTEVVAIIDQGLLSAAGPNLGARCTEFLRPTMCPERPLSGAISALHVDVPGVEIGDVQGLSRNPRLATQLEHTA